MTGTVAVRALTLGYVQGGGHFWVYLHWALALKALGMRVLWAEGVDPDLPAAEAKRALAGTQATLDRFGLGSDLVAFSTGETPLAPDVTAACLDEPCLDEADLLLDFGYVTPSRVLARPSTNALVDIDPGLTQVWWSHRQLDIKPHALYFTIGETVGRADAAFPDCGVTWHYTPPAVFLPEWPARRHTGEGSFTTLSHWWSNEWMFHDGSIYDNSKRCSFLQFLDLPARTEAPLELALNLGEDNGERERLERHGWKVREGWEVAPTPEAYRSYVQASLAEFSCAKPSCMRLRNAWVSDRTLCYLATGRPVVVQDTGPSSVLPSDAGMLRFSTVDGAARALRSVTEHYDFHAAAARRLAEERFDAERVVAAVLERALP